MSTDVLRPRFPGANADNSAILPVVHTGRIDTMGRPIIIDGGYAGRRAQLDARGLPVAECPICGLPMNAYHFDDACAECIVAGRAPVLGGCDLCGDGGVTAGPCDLCQDGIARECERSPR